MSDAFTRASIAEIDFDVRELSKKVTAIMDSESITLRDHFAGLAMQRMMSGDSTENDWSDSKVAEWSYALADAMIAARKDQS